MPRDTEAVTVNQSRLPRLVIMVADVVMYAFVATLIAVTLGIVLGLVTGSGWFGVVYINFLIGWPPLLYGAFKLRPEAAWKKDKDNTGTSVSMMGSSDDDSISLVPSFGFLGGGDDSEMGSVRGSRSDDLGETDYQESRINRIIHSTPPLKWYDTPEEGELPKGSKAFASGIFILASSLLIDMAAHWYGIIPPIA